jgi:hypothetical protein
MASAQGTYTSLKSLLNPKKAPLSSLTVRHVDHVGDTASFFFRQGRLNPELGAQVITPFGAPASSAACAVRYSVEECDESEVSKAMWQRAIISLCFRPERTKGCSKVMSPCRLGFP